MYESKMPAPKIQEIKLFDGYEGKSSSYPPRKKKEQKVYPQKSNKAKAIREKNRRDSCYMFMGIAIVALIITIIIAANAEH